MLTTGRVRLIFHYSFPEIELRRQEIDFNCATQYPSGQPQRRCEHFKGIVLNLYALKMTLLIIWQTGWRKLMRSYINYPGKAQEPHAEFFHGLDQVSL